MWSDFDGTAVELAGKMDPRNWLKYPLPMIPGYTDFLDGVEEGEVDIAGVVSRRPNIWPRRVVTERSIAQLGLSEYFEGSHIHLAGSEIKKAGIVVARSIYADVGLVDDKPHRVGVEMIRVLEQFGLPAVVKLGAVAHAGRTAYLDELKYRAEFAGAAVDESHDGQFNIAVGESTLRVVELEPYSFEAGQQFAEVIKES